MHFKKLLPENPSSVFLLTFSRSAQRLERFHKANTNIHKSSSEQQFVPPMRKVLSCLHTNLQKKTSFTHRCVHINVTNTKLVTFTVQQQQQVPAVRAALNCWKCSGAAFWEVNLLFVYYLLAFSKKQQSWKYHHLVFHFWDKYWHKDTYWRLSLLFWSLCCISVK